MNKKPILGLLLCLGLSGCLATGTQTEFLISQGAARSFLKDYEKMISRFEQAYNMDCIPFPESPGSVQDCFNSDGAHVTFSYRRETPTTVRLTIFEMTIGFWVNINYKKSFRHISKEFFQAERFVAATFEDSITKITRNLMLTPAREVSIAEVMKPVD